MVETQLEVCDVHYFNPEAKTSDEAEVEKATDFPVVLEDGTPALVALCLSHATSMTISQMHAFVLEFGEKLRASVPDLDEPAKGPELASNADDEQVDYSDDEQESEESEEGDGRLSCPMRGCTNSATTYKDRNSLSAHCLQFHKKSLHEWEMKQMGLKPDMPCRVSGCRRKFFSHQARGRHERQPH
jgi:hypothetical protein